MVVRLVERSYEHVVRYIDEVLRPIDIFQEMDPQVIFEEPLRFQKVPFTTDIDNDHLVSFSTTKVGSFQRSPGALRLQSHMLVGGLTPPPSHTSR